MSNKEQNDARREVSNTDCNHIVTVNVSFIIMLLFYYWSMLGTIMEV